MPALRQREGKQDPHDKRQVLAHRYRSSSPLATPRAVHYVVGKLVTGNMGITLQWLGYMKVSNTSSPERHFFHR